MRKNIKSKLLFVLLSVILLTSCKVNTNNESKTTENVETEQKTVYQDSYLVKVGDIAPDFKIITTDSTEYMLSDLKGKVVMLQFTASWCKVCREEMPHIESKIWQKHKDNSDFILLGVDREETPEQIKEFTKKVGTTYPIALDSNGDIFSLYAERKSGITRNVIINKDGEIVMLTRLYKEPEFNEMCELIDSLLETDN